MTPQLQQAIKLLQLSNLELADYLAAEVEKNPLLELAPARRRRPGAGVGAGAARRAATAAISTRMAAEVTLPDHLHGADRRDARAAGARSRRR